jgi:hypothetical protein
MKSRAPIGQPVGTRIPKPGSSNGSVSTVDARSMRMTRAALPRSKMTNPGTTRTTTPRTTTDDAIRQHSSFHTISSIRATIRLTLCSPQKRKSTAFKRRAHCSMPSGEASSGQTTPDQDADVGSVSQGGLRPWGSEVWGTPGSGLTGWEECGMPTSKATEAIRKFSQKFANRQGTSTHLPRHPQMPPFPLKSSIRVRAPSTSRSLQRG